MSPANTTWARSALRNNTKVIFLKMLSSALGSSLPPCQHLPHLLTSLHKDDVMTPWLSLSLPFLTGTVSQSFRKVKVVQKGSFKWSKWLAMNALFLFVFQGAPDTRMSVNNPAARIREGRFVSEDTHLRRTGAVRITQSYSLPVQTSFPRTKTTTREPNSP